MNNIKNNRLIWIVLLMWLCFLAPAHADSKEEGIDVQDIVFSHIQDAYTWHITEWNGKEHSSTPPRPSMMPISNCTPVRRDAIRPTP